MSYTLIPISNNESILSFDDEPCACFLPDGHVCNADQNYWFNYCEIPAGHVALG
jgi:hypothetical protein